MSTSYTVQVDINRFNAGKSFISRWAIWVTVVINAMVIKPWRETRTMNFHLKNVNNVGLNSVFFVGQGSSRLIMESVLFVTRRSGDNNQCAGLKIMFRHTDSPLIHIESKGSV